MWLHYVWYRIKIRSQINTVPTPTVAWTRAQLIQGGGGVLSPTLFPPGTDAIFVHPTKHSCTEWQTCSRIQSEGGQDQEVSHRASEGPNHGTLAAKFAGTLAKFQLFPSVLCAVVRSSARVRWQCPPPPSAPPQPHGELSLWHVTSDVSNKQYHPHKGGCQSIRHNNAPCTHHQLPVHISNSRGHRNFVEFW